MRQKYKTRMVPRFSARVTKSRSVRPFGKPRGLSSPVMVSAIVKLLVISCEEAMEKFKRSGDFIERFPSRMLASRARLWI